MIGLQIQCPCACSACPSPREAHETRGFMPKEAILIDFPLGTAHLELDSYDIHASRKRQKTSRIYHASKAPPAVSSFATVATAHPTPDRIRRLRRLETKLEACASSFWETFCSWCIWRRMSSALALPFIAMLCSMKVSMSTSYGPLGAPMKAPYVMAYIAYFITYTTSYHFYKHHTLYILYMSN